MIDGRTPPVVVELPPLDAHQALRIVALLEGICTAIWRAHGAQMSEHLIDVSERRDTLSDRDDVHLDDHDLPF